MPSCTGKDDLIESLIHQTSFSRQHSSENGHHDLLSMGLHPRSAQCCPMHIYDACIYAAGIYDVCIYAAGIYGVHIFNAGHPDLDRGEEEDGLLKQFPNE